MCCSYGGFVLKLQNLCCGATGCNTKSPGPKHGGESRTKGGYCCSGPFRFYTLLSVARYLSRI